MTWQPLEKTELDTLIKSVESKGMPGLFSTLSSKGQRKDLPFYTQFQLYDLRNYSTLPVFTMQYLGNGRDFFYLDGTPTAIHQVNEHFRDLSLTAQNIMDYISFFFTYVTVLEEEADMIRDPENLPYYDYLSEDQKAAITREKEQAQISYDPLEELYSIYSPLYYGGSLVKALIHVTERGHVSVKDYELLFGMNIDMASA